MMRNLTSHLVLLATLALPSGCAVGPLVIHETARTVGNSNHEISAAAGQTGYAFKLNYGLTPNLDLGIQLETLSLGARLKYAFLNQQSSGLSLAGAIGAGDSGGGNHYYGDVMASYLAGAFEPYANVRAVYVKADPTTSSSAGSITFSFTRPEFSYGQLMLGARLWLGSHVFLSGEASSPFPLSSSQPLTFDRQMLLGGALGVKF